jgi:hypothetical protein
MIPACPAAMIDDNGGSQTAKTCCARWPRPFPYVGNRNTNGEGQPLLILCPQHARLLANGGYSKAEVKHFHLGIRRLPFGSIPRGNLTSFSEKILKRTPTSIRSSACRSPRSPRTS